MYIFLTKDTISLNITNRLKFVLDPFARHDEGNTHAICNLLSVLDEMKWPSCVPASQPQPCECNYICLIWPVCASVAWARTRSVQMG